jgi:hypothetical protein
MPTAAIFKIIVGRPLRVALETECQLTLLLYAGLDSTHTAAADTPACP